MGPAGQKNVRVFRCHLAKILEKIARCARQGDQLDHQYRDFDWISITDEKSEDPAKMTHSISVLTLVDTV